MARVTVEDCIVKVPNRFDLVMLAAQRARDISAGAQLTVDRDNDKGPVVALREIAGETVELDGLTDSLIRGLQKQIGFDDDDDVEETDLILTVDGETEVQAQPESEADAAEAEDAEAGEDEQGAGNEGAEVENEDK